MAASRLGFPFAPAVLVGALVVGLSGCSDDTEKSANNGKSSGNTDATAPGQVQHLPTFTPPDAYAGDERQVRATLEPDASGCLTLDGNLVALPIGSEIADDESIELPDGKALRWWVPTTMYTYPTQPRKGTVNQRQPVPGLDACTADVLAPLTLVTFLPDPSESHVPADLALVLQRGDIEVADARFDNGLSADDSLAAFTEVYEIGPTPVDATPYAVTVVSSQESRLSAGLEVRMVHVPDVEQDHSGPLVLPDSERSQSADLIYTDMFAFFDANTGMHLLTRYIGPAQ